MDIYKKLGIGTKEPEYTSDEIGVGVHQGSAQSTLLFVVVMQETTREARSEGLWDLLYADDLVITAESEEDAVRKFGAWTKEWKLGD